MPRNTASAGLHSPHLRAVTNAQEMASRGMSVVYSIGDEAARKQLLDGLVGVLQGERIA